MIFKDRNKEEGGGEGEEVRRGGEEGRWEGVRSEPLGATQFVHSHYCLFRTPSVAIFVCPSLKRPSTKS